MHLDTGKTRPAVEVTYLFCFWMHSCVLYLAPPRFWTQEILVSLLACSLSRVVSVSLRLLRGPPLFCHQTFFQRNSFCCRCFWCANQAQFLCLIKVFPIAFLPQSRSGVFVYEQVCVIVLSKWCISDATNKQTSVVKIMQPWLADKFKATLSS